jgi:hypothetical protein
MEYSLDFNVSKRLVDVNGKEELTSYTFNLGSWDDHISLAGFKMESTGVLTLSFDWSQ